jgi:hypothetical protein
MRRKIALVSLALMVVASSDVFGQAQHGTISVTVTTAADGSALPGATIEAKSDQTLTSRSEHTGADGRAQLVALDPAANYFVTVTLEGFATARIEGVRVRAGLNSSVDVELQLEQFSEEMVITGESPVVDTTSTTAGQEITLELTESLPTGRSYQSYLQLVPGVQDALGTSENPASRSGINYRDVDGLEGDVGRSTDNLYYFDGINVTDRTEGTNGADLNTEIIQEQSILTGAIPAEFIGVPGLVSNVLTKSGGNEFSGSVNYYFIDDSLVEDNEHFPEETFETVDTAATLGGPIWRDKAWFFASFRRFENDRGIVDPEGNFLRDANQSADQGFGKVTWSITNSDLVSGIFLTDPTDRSASFNRSIPNTADSVGETGGERWSGAYNRVWGAAALELGGTEHNFDLNTFPKNRDPAATASFAPGVAFVDSEARLGGAGTDTIIERGTDSIRGSFEYLFDTGWGDHAVKVGVVDWSSVLFENPQTVGDPPATYISLNARGTDGSISLCEITGCAPGSDTWSTVDFGASTDEINNFNQNISDAQRQTLIAAGWDDDGDGFFSATELNSHMTFSSTSGNPQGLVNYTRDLQTQAGASEKSSESTHYFIQDSWQWNRWSVNAGVRVEDTTFINDAGEDVGTFDTEVAPRLSLTYDLRGDGRSSVGVFYGEYYDAFRDNAIDFAGSLTGRVIEEQVWVEALDDWVNFRFRGGTTVQDAFFAPRIETPVTEEIQLQYKQDLGRNMMFEVNYIDRETTGIAEDYGSLYYNVDHYIGAGGDPNAADSFFLGPGFFGFGSLGEIPTNLNFLIGSLPGAAFRDWQGVELVFRKRYSDNWQLLASYNWADGEANTYSDSNFDGAGDVPFLDPRAPNITGLQAGLVEHLFKLHGSYRWDNGIQVGSSYRWNSGVVLNRNQGQAFSRSIPDRTETPFPSNGFSGNTDPFTDLWIGDDAVGFIEGSEYGVLDLRGSYIWTPGDRFEVDLFLDVFNVADDQATVRVQDLVSGGSFDFLEGMEFVEPRRYNLGVRLRF